MVKGKIIFKVNFAHFHFNVLGGVWLQVFFFLIFFEQVKS